MNFPLTTNAVTTMTIIDTRWTLESKIARGAIKRALEVVARHHEAWANSKAIERDAMHLFLDHGW